MRFRLLSIACLLVFAAGGVSAQFYSGLGSAERRELAEAYYLAGQQYRKLGATKGADFVALAYEIYPTLDPDNIVEADLPSLEELLARGTLDFLGGATESAVEELIRSRFLRIAGAFLTEDVSGVVRGIAGSIMLTPQNLEISQRQAQVQLASLFENVSLSGLRLAQVYDLESVDITLLEPSPVRLGPTYRLRLDARADLSGFVPFWSATQNFFISRSSTDQWLITAIGSSLPPRNWSPQLPDAAAVASGVDTGAVRRLIAGAFENTVAAFLDKDADGVVRHLSDQLTLTRQDRVVVARDAVRSLAQSHFDMAPYVALRPAEVVTVQSVEVASRGEDVFVLTARFSEMARNALPEWTVYREFFFGLEGSLWKVFAIS